jgi:glycosyltransferase involved in cell wall biosynthesis
VVDRKPTVALVSREVAPFGGGGIGRYVSALATLLADEFEVTIFTTSRHRPAHDEARRERPASLPPAKLVFVREPRPWDARASFSRLHAWSSRVHEALLSEYGGRGPDLVEFGDFLGEGCVTVQAKRTGSAVLRETMVCVRIHGSAEVYDVLDGFLPGDRERSFTHELERYSLRYADSLLWAGGDILGSYERFYGADQLAAARLVRHPFEWSAAAEPAATPSGPLRLLYLGRLERRKGVRELVDALLGLERADWRLTMVGGDTETAPLGGSMRELLALQVAGDERIELVEAVPRDQVPELLDDHDALVIPSRWECWPYVALEAMARGRPIVATPTGGLCELVADGESGWLTRAATVDGLAGAIEPLVERPQQARTEHDAEAARGLFASLTAPESIRDAYRELCEPAPAAGTRAGARPAAAEPLVSIVIPYFELAEHVGDAVASAAAQTHPRCELIVVNDGSFRAEDEILLELEARYELTLVAQPNSGLGAARNLGIELSRGEYVLPLDADNVLEPEFVARCVSALEADPEIAYVGSWLRYIDERGRPWKGTDEGLSPIGNSSRAVDSLNVAGDACAVFRGSIFRSGLAYSTDVAGFEDWALYREMRRRGMIGHVIPEPLVRYRMRADSMMRSLSSPREAWIRQAIEAHLAETAVEWTVPR